ncbi:MAG: proteasome-type protease [Cyanobacteria bacterium SID2]|nr:proteasome-type protease [Cyanobacteria bacterium SID2]MBP0004439.1 proteasome-type protease [Cyanobacteria bacterium SBC]
MTYCLGIVNSAGLVFGADSRTNAGVDYISTYHKLFDFTLPGERAIVLCTSGNLSVTQAVMHQVRRDLKQPEDENLYTLPSLYDTARYIGKKIRTIQEIDRPWFERDRIDFQCNFLVGGQIRGEEPKLFLVYPQGNCIQATPETPFLQIGETKYGKPILDRLLQYDTPLEIAVKSAVLSIDSTMKSNISVGPPINVIMYQRDTFEIRHRLRLRLGSPYLAKIRQYWEDAVLKTFEAMPDIEWQDDVGVDRREVLID